MTITNNVIARATILAVVTFLKPQTGELGPALALWNEIEPTASFPSSHMGVSEIRGSVSWGPYNKDTTPPISRRRYAEASANLETRNPRP